MPFDTAMNREISNKIRKMLELQIKHTANTYDVAEGIVATDGRELVNEDNIIPKREKLMDLSENLPEPEKELTGGSLGSIGGYGRATIRDLGVGKVLDGVSGRGKPKSNNVSGRGKPKSNNYKSFEEMTLKSLKKIAKIYNNLVNIDNVDNLTKEELITELEKHLYFSGKNLKTKVETMELTKKDKEEIKKILQEENMNVKEKSVDKELELEVKDIPQVGVKVLEKVPVKRRIPKKKATPKTRSMSSANPEETIKEVFINPFIGQGKRKTTKKTNENKTNETKSLKLKRMVVGGKKPRGRPSKMKGGADLAKPYNMVNEKGLTGNGKNKLDRKIGGNLKVVSQLQGSTLSGMGKKKKARSDIVKDVMKKRGCSMIEASKIVKNEGLY